MTERETHLGQSEIQPPVETGPLTLAQFIERHPRPADREGRIRAYASVIHEQFEESYVLRDDWSRLSRREQYVYIHQEQQFTNQQLRECYNHPELYSPSEGKELFEAWHAGATEITLINRLFKLRPEEPASRAFLRDLSPPPATDQPADIKSEMSQWQRTWSALTINQKRRVIERELEAQSRLPSSQETRAFFDQARTIKQELEQQLHPKADEPTPLPVTTEAIPPAGPPTLPDLPSEPQPAPALTASEEAEEEAPPPPAAADTSDSASPGPAPKPPDARPGPPPPPPPSWRRISQRPQDTYRPEPRARQANAVTRELEQQGIQGIDFTSRGGVYALYQLFESGFDRDDIAEIARHYPDRLLGLISHARLAVDTTLGDYARHQRKKVADDIAKLRTLRHESQGRPARSDLRSGGPASATTQPAAQPPSPFRPIRTTASAIPSETPSQPASPTAPVRPSPRPIPAEEPRRQRSEERETSEIKRRRQAIVEPMFRRAGEYGVPDDVPASQRLAYGALLEARAELKLNRPIPTRDRLQAIFDQHPDILDAAKSLLDPGITDPDTLETIGNTLHVLAEMAIKEDNEDTTPPHGDAGDEDDDRPRQKDSRPARDEDDEQDSPILLENNKSRLRQGFYDFDDPWVPAVVRQLRGVGRFLMRIGSAANDERDQKQIIGRLYLNGITDQNAQYLAAASRIPIMRTPQNSLVVMVNSILSNPDEPVEWPKDVKYPADDQDGEPDLTSSAPPAIEPPEELSPPPDTDDLDPNQAGGDGENQAEPDDNQARVVHRDSTAPSTQSPDAAHPPETPNQQEEQLAEVRESYRDQYARFIANQRAMATPANDLAVGLFVAWRLVRPDSIPPNSFRRLVKQAKANEDLASHARTLMTGKTEIAATAALRHLTEYVTHWLDENGSSA